MLVKTTFVILQVLSKFIRGPIAKPRTVFLDFFPVAIVFALPATVRHRDAIYQKMTTSSNGNCGKLEVLASAR
jgi:hypothetical protein